MDPHGHVCLTQAVCAWSSCPRPLSKTLQDKCYSFITLSNSQQALEAIHALNGQVVAGGQMLRVNYALMPPSDDKERGETPAVPHGEGPVHPGTRGPVPQHQIFVGDLSTSVDDTKLYNTFAKYTSCV